MTRAWTILHAGALGDLVLTIQLALRLADTHGGGERTLRLVSRTNPGDLSGCCPQITRVSSESAGLHWAYAHDDSPASRTLRDAMAGRHVLAALGVPETPACVRLRTLEPRSFFSFEPAAQPGIVRHITEQWSMQLEGQGLLLPKCIRHRGPVIVRPPQPLKRRGRDLLGAALKPYAGRRDVRPICVLHPGSGGVRKCWPASAFAALAQLVGECADVVAIMGPAEVERGVPPRFQELAPGVAVLLCENPDDLAAILAGADAFVGNDAGPTHLAALLGKPTIALFGPSSSEVWRPVGPQVQVVRGDVLRDPDQWGISAAEIAQRVAAVLASGESTAPAGVDVRGGDARV